MILANIKELCEKKNITIKQLERELEIGNGTISRWDQSSPTVENLQKVAKYFKVSLDKLLRE